MLRPSTWRRRGRRDAHDANKKSAADAASAATVSPQRAERPSALPAVLAVVVVVDAIDLPDSNHRSEAVLEHSRVGAAVESVMSLSRCSARCGGRPRATGGGASLP